MKLKDLRIDVAKAQAFISRWAVTTLSLADFNRMLEESASWHNMPIEVIKTMSHFEVGYPSKSSYSANTHSGSYFGPFQIGQQYMDGVVEQIRTDYYNWMGNFPHSPSKLTLGQQLYFNVAEKVRIAHASFKGYSPAGNLPLTAGVVYSFHIMPFAMLDHFTKFGVESRAPNKVTRTQSAAVKKYFASANLSKLQPVALNA